jgi:Spy/CpxP family protein refolding chaperone
MKSWIRKVITVSSLVAGASAALPAGIAFAQTPPAQEQPAQGSPGKHHHRGHGVGLVGAALHVQSLTAEQRTQIDQLVQERRAAAIPVRQADAQVLTVLAQQVESAKVDPQSLGPSLSAERAAAVQERDVDRATLNRLHAILTPAQRNELVDSVEAHEGAHGAQGRPDGGARERSGALKLGLTQEQKAQIRANLAAERPAHDRTAKRGQMRASLESFRGDSFDGNAMAHAEGRGAREVHLAGAMVPVLTPQQRAAFATALRQRAAHESRS